MALEDVVEQRYTASQMLWWLIVGRLAIALILVSARVIWVHDNTRQAWLEILPALAVIGSLTLLYSIIHRFSRTLLFQARLQFFIDIILVTWLVWTTGVVYSPYIALYIVIIAASSLFLGPRDAIVTSVGCAVAFTAGALVLIE